MVNCYVPNVTPRHIAQTIVQHAFNKQAPATFDSALNEIATEIELRRTQNKPHDIFLLLHSLDSPLLRTFRAQQQLAELASISGIHIIASVDGLHSLLLWDAELASSFTWVWINASTYVLPLFESQFRAPLIARARHGAVRLATVLDVLKSVSQNSRKLLK